MSSRLRTRLRAGTGLSTPSLSLEFQTATGALDPRITFSRTSQATLVDSTGKLTYAPNNLLENSEAFEAATWTKAASGVGVAPVVTANVAASPTGTMTADRIQFNLGGGTTTSDWSSIYRTTSIANATNHIYSVWLRSNDSNSYTILARDDLGSGGTAVLWTVTPTWQRFSYLATSTSTVSNGLRLWLRGGQGTSSTADLLIWGAQLEQVTYQTTPGTYNSTSPKNLLGYTQEFDNAAWTKSNAFVQTNLLTYSEAFDNAAWTKGFTTVTANPVVAPNGSLSADKIVETTDVSVTHFVQGGSAVTSGVQYTISCYARSAGEGRRLTFGGAGIGAANEYPIFDLDTGTVDIAGTTTVVKSATITPVGGGWYRCVAVVTAGGTAAIQYILTTATTDNSAAAQAYTGNGTSGLYIWGAQLVQGSTAGDYQRTDAAAAAVQYVAPDGSRTADKLAETTATGTHYVVSNGPNISVISGTPYTYSCYFKAAERSWAFMEIAGTPFGCYAFFDLVNGVVGATSGSPSSTSITAVGNGWYRCTIAKTATASAFAYAVAYTSTGNGTTSYTGDGTSGIYIWGAQLSNSASLDPYVYNPVAAPTSAAYYGPRFDYDPVTLANKGLLIEEQRTNVALYSEAFDNAAWSKSNATITANATLSPDGTANADALIADTANALHYVSSSFGSAVTTYTLSFFAKSAGYRFVVFTNNGGTNMARGFDLSNGTTFVNTSGYSEPLSYAIVPVGNGWYRCSITFNKTIATSCGYGVWLNNGSADTFAGNGTSGVYLYGAQLEAGSFATSYIPTVASQVTRTADVALMQGANFSNWYNLNQGTFTAEFTPMVITGDRGVLSANDGTGNNDVDIRASSSPTSVVATGGVSQAILTVSGAAVGVSSRMALAYATNNFAAVRDGGTPAADASGTTPAVDRMQIGNLIGSTAYALNGHIRRIGYYPTRLANAQLQSLTAQSTIPSLSLDFTTQVFNVG